MKEDEEIVIKGDSLNFFQRLKGFLKSRNGKILLIILGIFILAILSILYNLLWLNNKPETAQTVSTTPKSKNETPKPTPTPQLTANPYNGAYVEPALANRRAVAVMIENHPDARPQFGLSKADIVYEMVTEGGITRFLALFATSDPPKVGPVRSARTPFLSWVLEYDAGYAHVGGSADALQNIKTMGIKDLDQFNNASPYWRDSSRRVAVEHTMYTSVANLRGLFTSKKWGTERPSFEPWQFSDDVSLSERPESQEEIVPYENEYLVKWVYQKNENAYLRKNGEYNALDASTNKEILAKNVVVLKMKTTQITNSAGKKVAKVETIGRGSGYILQNGKKLEVTWQKEAPSKRLRLFLTDNSEVKFVRGPIWIAILPI